MKAIKAEVRDAANYLSFEFYLSVKDGLSFEYFNRVYLSQYLSEEFHRFDGNDGHPEHYSSRVEGKFQELYESVKDEYEACIAAVCKSEVLETDEIDDTRKLDIFNGALKREGEAL